MPVSGMVTIPASGAAIFIRSDSIEDVKNIASASDKLEINPNPVHNNATIIFSNTERTPATISIINILGERVATIFSGELEAGEHAFNWNANHITPGFYRCMVQTKEGISHSSIILQF